jgi:ABC-type maltose transport system permease subunit
LFPGTGNENIHSAAAILGMLPLIVIYCFLQKYFIEGVTAGSVKE